jgi:hypothetical protein
MNRELISNFLHSFRLSSEHFSLYIIEAELIRQ